MEHITNSKGKFISYTSRAPQFTGICEIDSEIKRPFWRLGEKYPEFPFGLSICFDCCPKETGEISKFKIKPDDFYRGNIRLMLNIVIYCEDVSSEAYIQDLREPDSVKFEANKANSRKLLGNELVKLFQEVLLKQFKKYPELKKIYPDFIMDIKHSLMEIDWLEGDIQKQKPDLIDDNNYYYDDDFDGISRETSHPNFVNYFCEDFYYDEANEEAPFGNDVGHDALRALEQNIKQNEIKNIESFPKQLMESWGYEYTEPLFEKQISHIDLDRDMENNRDYYIVYNQTIFALALGQIKITGKINKRLKELAKISFMKILSVWIYEEKIRTESMSKKFIFMPGRIKESELVRISYEDLESFELYNSDRPYSVIQNGFIPNCGEI